MTKRTPIIMIAALFLLAAASGRSDGADRQSPALRIGIVDVRKVFDSLDAWKEISRRLKELEDSIAVEDKRRMKHLDALQAEMQDGLRPPGGEKLEEYDRASLDRNIWLAYQHAKLQRESLIEMQQMYDRIKSAARQVAEQRELELVLQGIESKGRFVESLDKVRGDQVEQAFKSFQTPAFLYINPRVDVTQDVITMLNREAAGALPAK